jgi:hypothetical protein
MFLIILKASLIDILILNCKYAFSVIHEVFKLSFIYLLFPLIQRSHFSFHWPVIDHLAFEQKIIGFQDSLAFPFIFFPFSIVKMPSRPCMLAFTMP